MLCGGPTRTKRATKVHRTRSVSGIVARLLGDRRRARAGGLTRLRNQSRPRSHGPVHLVTELRPHARRPERRDVVLRAVVELVVDGKRRTCRAPRRGEPRLHLGVTQVGAGAGSGVEHRPGRTHRGYAAVQRSFVGERSHAAPPDLQRGRREALAGDGRDPLADRRAGAGGSARCARDGGADPGLRLPAPGREVPRPGRRHDERRRQRRLPRGGRPGAGPGRPPGPGVSPRPLRHGRRRSAAVRPGARLQRRRRGLPSAGDDAGIRRGGGAAPRAPRGRGPVRDRHRPRWRVRRARLDPRGRGCSSRDGRPRARRRRGLRRDPPAAAAPRRVRRGRRCPPARALRSGGRVPGRGRGPPPRVPVVRAARRRGPPVPAGARRTASVRCRSGATRSRS